MPYRSTSEAHSGTGDLVTVRRYLDPVAAQLDRTRLSAEGIEAYVIEAASFNPMLSGAGGGTRLQVREGDLARAESLLQDHPEAPPRDDGEGPGVVRCPRCELAYCFHERLRIEGSSAMTALAIVAAPFMALWPKRWHCHKCGHVWDDPKQGPAEMTKLEEDDPHPIFRLRRAHAGMGLFLGLVIGVFGALVAAAAMPRELGLPVAMLCAGPLLGWLIGRALRYDVCSEPSCRAALASDREDCPRCQGSIAGVIDAADAHYASAADFRRELAALHAKDRPRRGFGGEAPNVDRGPKKKKKKARA